MTYRSFENVSLDDMIDILREELNRAGIKHHISWVTKPPLPAASGETDIYGDWDSIAWVITNLFPVVFLHRYYKGVLYMSFLLEQKTDE